MPATGEILGMRMRVHDFKVIYRDTLGSVKRIIKLFDTCQFILNYVTLFRNLFYNGIK